MKKSIINWITIIMVAIVGVGIVSCIDDDDDSDDLETPINPVDPKKGEAMSAADQKEYLEKVALEFMDLMPASDFRDIVELGEFIEENYGDDYDWDSVEDWAKNAFDASREALGTKETESETEKWGSNTYKYNYIYTNYKALLLASNFTGHFTARNGRWVFAKANDLQFVFTDKRGQECVLKLETSGNVKKVYMFNDDDWKNYDYNSVGNTHTYNEYFDRTQCTIGVPEIIMVTLTQGGAQVIKTTVKVNMDRLSNEEFDISKNSITLSVLAELSNGYNIYFSNVAYTGNKDVAVTFTMSKKGTSHITVGVAADINDLPSVKVSEFSSESYDTDKYDWDDVNAKNAFVKLDVLGKVQIQGTLKDTRKYFDYLEEADHNDSNEKTFKSYINQANSLADIHLFYDGKNVRQAGIRLEPFADETWNGRTYWEAEPVICFYDDDTSYSTFEVFFNEKDFKKTIDTFKKLANKYADLVDERIDW